MEIRGHQETAKNFDNVLKFTDILQKNQPKLYKEYFRYFDDFLIDYFCFQQDKLRVNQSFSNFMENPLQDYDKFLLSFNKILFYQYSELLEQTILKNFALVKESDDLMGNAEYDLAMCRFYISLQEIYKEKKEQIDRIKFSSNLSEYNFKFEDDFLSSLETGILKPQIDTDKLRDLFVKNKNSSIIILQGYFLRHMYEKGFDFYLSGKIWDIMLRYWQKNNSSKKTIETYFTVDSRLFEKYLAGYSANIFLDNTSEMIAILWGSVYIFEFLRKHQIISEKSFGEFIVVSRSLKGKAIGQFTSDLWNSNFVHEWEKPDCILETEFQEENNIFHILTRT